MTLLKNILIITAILFSFNSMFAKSDTLNLKVMTYNLRFGELASLEQIASHIKSFNPDFVALEEVDVNTTRDRAPKQNGKDLISTLAYETGLFGSYGKTINYAGGYYGIGILSKYPVIDLKKILLPNPENKEPRALLVGTFEVGKDTIMFATTHLDVNSAATREKQAEFIQNYLKDSKYPVILGGDFNAKPSEIAIKDIFDKKWFNATNTDLTFPAWKPTIKIDYIFCLPKNDWKIIRTQAVQSCLSDHLPVVSEIQYISK